MCEKKYKIEEEELTLQELKQRILLHKEQDKIEEETKFKEKFGYLPPLGLHGEPCIICLKRVYMIWHADGFVCSPECIIVYKHIFDKRYQNTEEQKLFCKLRRELWEAQGWRSPNKKKE